MGRRMGRVGLLGASTKEGYLDIKALLIFRASNFGK